MLQLLQLLQLLRHVAAVAAAAPCCSAFPAYSSAAFSAVLKDALTRLFDTRMLTYADVC
jgi:hypothetical protein